jgi:hypothetical protein
MVKKFYNIDNLEEFAGRQMGWTVSLNSMKETSATA